MENEKTFTCPHCGEILETWDPAPETGWDHELLMCNNDACVYFTGGRKKIRDELRLNFGYRYCFDPVKGRGIPVAAWCGGHLSLLKGRCSA